MQASELRIGNFVLSNNLITKIEFITEDGINQDVDFGQYGSMNYEAWFSNDLQNRYIEPIPLTEEWLLKFGFKENIISLVLETDNFFFSYSKKNQKFEVQYNSRDGHRLFPVKIEHVHQVQNLYFALTGEEFSYE